MEELDFKSLFLGEECADNFAPDYGEEKVFSTTLISGNSTSSILVSRAGSSASGIVESSKIIKVAAAVPSKR